jgi:hypothetical protein
MEDRELKKQDQLRKLESALAISAGLLALDSGIRSVIPIFNLTIIGVPIAITLFALSRAIHLHSTKKELIYILDYCKFFVFQFYKLHVSNLAELSVYMKHILSISENNSSSIFTYAIELPLLEKIKDSFTIINILIERVAPNKNDNSYFQKVNRFYNRNFSAKFYKEQLKKELLILIGLFNIYQIKFTKIKEIYRNYLRSHEINVLKVENEVYSTESYHQSLQTVDALQNLENNTQVEQQKELYQEEIVSKESDVHKYLIEQNDDSTLRNDGGRKSRTGKMKQGKRRKKLKTKSSRKKNASHSKK